MGLVLTVVGVVGVLVVAGFVQSGYLRRSTRLSQRLFRYRGPR